MRVVTRTFMLALVALALLPSGARAQTSEQTCLKERLIAIGKAAQCQSGAIAKYCASTQTQKARDAAMKKCEVTLIEGYATAARRSGFPTCFSPKALAEAIEAVNGTTQIMVPAAKPITEVVDPPTAAVVSNGKGGTYTDNGNGTVTDSTTGLVWEQKTTDGSIHDVDNTYTWATPAPDDSTAISFNGTAATVFLATLNTAPCFAGYCDWRLPTIIELSGQEATGIANGGIVDLTPRVCGCGGACINAIFRPTRADGIEHGFVGLYWSSSTYEGSGSWPSAWGVAFGTGSDGYVNKTYPNYVRAVRNGP